MRPQSSVAPSEVAGGTLRGQMTWLSTRYLAAQVIAEANFPKREQLPKPQPPSFLNFGHQLLVDYPRLVGIVWSVVVQVQAELEPLVAARRRRRWWMALSVVASLILLGMISAPIPGLVPLLIIVGVPVIIALEAPMKKRVKRTVARVRADAIRALLDDQYPRRPSSVVVPPALVGTGELDGARAPVLTIVDDERPFCGFGELKIDNLFVCRPKDDAAERPSLDELTRTIHQRAIDKVEELRLPESSHGEVVVVAGSSLSSSSAWLGGDKSPQLWMSREWLNRIDQLDPGASARVYQATQILFPEQMTAATFFVRLFLAGNAAAFQVAVTTLGSPRAGREALKSRLLTHAMEEEKGRWDTSASLTTAEREALGLLLRPEAPVPGTGDSFEGAVNLDEIIKLNATEETQRSAQYQMRFEQVLAGTAQWPGRASNETVWRERHSYAFPRDFFGRPEALATVRTVYDQIARSILDSLADAGFDISDYRDSEGKYSINADKIEQLIVGEKVQITQTKNGQQAEAPAEAKPAAAAGGSR